MRRLPNRSAREENHQSDADHHKNNSAPHIRALAHGWRGRSQQCGRHRLTFFRQHSNRAVLHSGFGEPEIHDDGDDQNGRSENASET